MSIDFNDGKCLNDPAQWRAADAGLTLTTDEKTDFWRETHYGFTRSSGQKMPSREAWMRIAPLATVTRMRKSS
ncbi:DUF1349 domain-containing protein, partial [Rhizobium ruizarguesonis]